MNRMLVIGGTGRVGRHVGDLLAGTDSPFRVMTRNPDAAGLRQHVEVVRGDLNVPKTFDDCLRDVDTVFLVWTASPVAVPSALERIVECVARPVPHSTPENAAAVLSAVESVPRLGGTHRGDAG